MEKCFGVDRDALNQPRDVQITSVTVSEYLSPYDIPAAIVVDTNAEQHATSIRFVYVSEDEPRERVELEPGVEGEVGKKSGRVLGITFRRSAVRENETWADALLRIVANLGKDSIKCPRMSKTGNYRAVTSAVEQNATQLSAALVAQ